MLLHAASIKLCGKALHELYTTITKETDFYTLSSHSYMKNDQLGSALMRINSENRN